MFQHRDQLFDLVQWSVLAQQQVVLIRFQQKALNVLNYLDLTVVRHLPESLVRIAREFVEGFAFREYAEHLSQ